MTAGTGGWVHAEEWGRRGCRCASSECGGVDGQRTQTHEAQGLGKDAFRCDFIAGLLHIHTAMKEKSKKKKSRGRRWDENIATVVREWKMREGKSKARNESEWQILSTGYTRQGGFIWILHDLKHRKLAEWIIWQKVHPQMGSGLLMIGPDLLGAMQPAAIPKSSLHLPSFRVPNLSEAHNQSKQFTLSCTQIHTWSIGGKNACAKKKKKFKLKKYLKMVMAKTVKLRFSIYNEHMWLRQLTQS